MPSNDPHLIDSIVLEVDGRFSRIGDRYSDGSLRHCRWIDSITDPRQDHDTKELPASVDPGYTYKDGIKHGFDAGKASLNPFDRDELLRFLVDLPNGSVTSLADAIANHFAAPERNTLHVNTEMRSYFREAYNATARRHGHPQIDASYTWNAFNDMEKVYYIEPQPALVEERCPDCEHKDGLFDTTRSYCGHKYCECTNDAFHRKVDAA